MEEEEDQVMKDLVKDETDSVALETPELGSTPAESSSAATPAPTTDLTAEEKEAEAMSEFGSEGGEDREDEDAKLAKEMEEDGGESDDSEMAGLQDDAELPIEELMKKYGYGGGGDDSVATTVEEPITNGLKEESPAVKGVDGDDSETEDAKEEDGEEQEEIANDHESENGEEEREASPLVKTVHLQPPFLLRATLRPYQQAGLEWLASLYAGGVNG